jgi:uncharacterized DUF497 family protein
MQIEFDPEKDAGNLEKHGISLAFGAEILADADRLDILDVRFDYAEERFVAYGMAENRVWVCVFAIRGEVYRIISVRKANERETQRYRQTPR